MWEDKWDGRATKGGCTKIAFFTETYHPTINGVVISMDLFKEELEKHGHEVHIFAPGKKGFYDPTGSRVYRLPAFPIPGHPEYPVALPWYPTVAPFLRGLGVDLVHCHHLFGIGTIGLRAAHRLHLPIVMTYHTLLEGYTHYLGPLSSVGKRLVIGRSKWFAHQTDLVITPSPAMRTVLHSYGIRKPIVALPTGIKLDDYQRIDPKLLRAKYHIPPDRKILLYVGRIAVEKNISFLLEAYRQLLISHPATHLLLVGGGPALDTYRRLGHRLRLDHMLTWTGFIQPAETKTYFGAAHLFVFPSTTDTQGIVIVEALASGTPVVALNSLGPADLIEDGKTGYLVPEQTGDFVDRVRKILDNDSLHRELSHHAQIAGKRFAIEHTADVLQDLYALLLRPKENRESALAHLAGSDSFWAG